MPNVPDVNSDSNTHKFPYSWNLADGYPAQGIEKHGAKVFSFFACGGGSSMGYKLAGYDVLGCCEIDPKIIEVYKANHHPKYAINLDIRDFNALPDSEIPEELFDLDVLDGSPPCSVFSTAGLRDKAWNTEKKFAEGQKKQKLDDLFFHFIETARRLQPRFIISENVSGLLKGHAKGYVIEIIKGFDDAGYNTQLFMLNAATMGVPQKRQRSFFICSRKDLALSKIQLDFSEQPIRFGEIRNDENGGAKLTAIQYFLWRQRIPEDKNLGDVNKRIFGKSSSFNRTIVKDDRVMNTITSYGENHMMLYELPRKINQHELKLASTFPLDYDFQKQDSSFICGMSVPPVMMAQVAHQVYLQWLAPLTEG